MKAIVSVSPALNEPLLTTVFPTAAGNTEMRTLVVQQPTDLHMLRDHLQSSAEAVVVLFSRAEYAMAAWVRAGWSLDKAAEHWQALVRDLLEIQKSQRQRILLVDCDEWLGQPELWPTRCLEAGYMPDVVDVIKPQTDLALLACCHFVRLNSGIMHLNSLLVASSLPLTEQDSLRLLPLDDVLHQHFLQQQRLSQLQDQVATQQLRLQQQGQQLQTVERQLNSVNQLKQDFEQSSKQHIAELQTSLHQAQQLQLPVQQENELLLTQLHKVQEQLEATLNSADRQVQDLRHQLAETETAYNSLQSLQQTTEAELTEKTQQLSSTAANNELKADVKALQQAEHENTLLLDQLFKVQEQLEDYYLQIERSRQQPENPALLSIQCRLTMLATVLRRVAHEPALLSRESLEERVALLSSPLFDPIWYQNKYMPEGSSPMDAADHYLTIGTVEMFNPGPEFDATNYLVQHEDVAAAALDPLLHFEWHGRTEGRQYHAVAEGVN
ncbi:hypothetical protein ACFFJP_02840 [Rheinheimera tilapiae]|uniref:Chromosome partitioning protein ParA n=2 Tax=Rheinheimera tilapiae TaxID=875043 RepID=A0ABV6B8N1_9GAMM